jgi:adenylate kinase family enzyme
MSERSIVNIIGKAGTGKSTLAAHLAERFGFEIYRPSDTIRAHARDRNIPLKSRQDYVDTHRHMRIEDPYALARPVLTSTTARICIDGLRVPANARLIQKELGLHTIRLASSPEKDAERLQRTLDDAPQRHSRDDARIASLAAFLADETVDENNLDPFEPNIAVVEAMADITIHAFQPQETVFAQADAYVTWLLAVGQTP